MVRTNCLGCGKPLGGFLDAYSTKLMYGEVCLTCKKKLASIQNHQFMTPEQISNVIKGKVQKSDIRISPNFTPSFAEQAKHSSPAEEIRQCKELLDDGIITQAEFDKMKKRIIDP
ncbi:MAG: SHOCT domain-containing protein [Candidatus Methanoplasma sp.]|jgi:predicted Fe-S protein YdhL (DUF1289 family)|nr:SHOCT domain-containing protein [Candidatus Methanoplasma sp.]